MPDNGNIIGLSYYCQVHYLSYGPLMVWNSMKRANMSGIKKQYLLGVGTQYVTQSKYNRQTAELNIDNRKVNLLDGKLSLVSWTYIA